MDIISISDNTSPNSTRSTGTGFNVKLSRRNSVTSLPITIASGSTQKCPVTWNSEPKHRISISSQLVNNVTPMVNNRVKMWLASTMQLQQSATMSSPQHNTSFEHSDSGSNSSIMDEYIIQRSHREELPKRNILIRHDFDRDDEIISNVCSYNPSWKCNSDVTLNGHSSMNKGSESISSHDGSYFCARKNENNDGDSENVKRNMPKMNNNEVPLSPETQKKNELCSYLQLMNMNCTDRKMASKIQNRRSTRVKNLIIMSEKKELERQLNNEAKNKEKESNNEEKKRNLSLKSFGGSDIDIKEVDEQEHKLSDTRLKKKEPAVRISERRRSLSLKSLENVNLFSNDLRKNNNNENKEKIALTPKSRRILLKRRHSLNTEVKRKDLASKYFETSVKKEKNSNIFKLFNINDIPDKILMKRVDFDETIKSFMNTEICDVKINKPAPNNIKTDVNDAPVKKKYIRKKYVRTKFSNRNLKNLSTISSPKSLFNMSPIKSLHSKKVYRKKIATSSTELQKSIKRKQNFVSKRKKYYSIMLRNSGRQNLRSRVSLSNVGIKSLILKDKNDSDDERNIKMKKRKKMYKKQKQRKSPPKKVDELFKKGNKKSIVEETNVVDTENDNISLATPFIQKSKCSMKRKFEKDQIENDKMNEISEITNSIENEKNTEPSETDHSKDDSSIKQGSLSNEFPMNDVLIENNLAQEDCASEFGERTFNIIDLSHSKIPGNIDVLTDHDYTLKRLTDDVMDIVVGTDERSIVLETVESVSDDTDCKSSEDVLLCNKEGEYCREKLEEIIGVSWKNIQKSNNKIEDYISDTKIEIIESPKKSSDYQYSLYRENSVLKPGNSNKNYNIRIQPLLEPSSSIFDEDSCTVHPPVEQQLLMNEINSKPRVITMPVPPEVKSLHKSLMHTKRKLQLKNELLGDTSNLTWDNEATCEDKRSHSIKISPSNGCVVNAFYVDFNLVIVQEQSVSFWCQSALGNMLGSQDLWICKGSLQRLVLDNTCVSKQSSDMIISLENSFAYVELWTKEHKSDKRERPLADVFATVYFWRHRQNIPNRKFLQLENINGKGSDVQYIVLQNSRSIVVSWVEIRDDMKKTVVHCYSLAADYQTVVSIRELHTVDHCVTSLHNIEDCNTMVMGFGEEQVTLWNLEYGYVVATIEIKSVSLNPRCVWIKCDRGFLFLLQYHQLERLLVLIAINGISHNWKRIQVFRTPYGYEGLQGVCIDNNVLAAFYQRGVLCWNIQTGESVIEEMSSQTTYLPCDKHIVILNSDKVQVQQFLSYFVTSFDLQ